MTILFICSIVEWLSNEQNFKDYIFPLISLVLTFLSAYWMSNHSFKKHIEKEKKEKEEDDENYRIFFEENLLKALKTILTDIISFRNILIERYDIHESIIPTPVLGVTKELNIVEEADLRRLEEIYKIRTKDDIDRELFYTSMNAVSRQIRFYKNVELEFNSINSFLKKFDIQVFSSYERLVRESMNQIEEYARQESGATEKSPSDKLNLEEIDEFTKIVSGFASDTNNFSKMTETVERMEAATAFEKAVG